MESETIDPPALNPRFRAELPQIVEKLSQVLLVCRQPLADARVTVGELHDYLDFEIKKCQLDIDKMRWETRADPNELARVEAWKIRLEGLRSFYPINDTDESIAFLDRLISDLQQTVG